MPDPDPSLSRYNDSQNNDNRVFTIQYVGTDQFCMESNDVRYNDIGIPNRPLIYLLDGLESGA